MRIIAPQYTWMACGGVGSLNHNKVKPLIGNKIILFPDLDINSAKSPYNVWQKKALEFRKLGLHVHVSDLLEKKANEEQRKTNAILQIFSLYRNPRKTKVFVQSDLISLDYF